jgi:acyl-CoA synthetase (AMP-forming)/AMP-acid ligase II/NADP-dependent 3-hydroxy acid dehydrogenase YdfG/acyl carrier protein
MSANDPEIGSLSPRQCDCRRVEQVLLAHPSIADCAVLERTTGQGQSELLAYIVPASAFAVEDLFASLETTAVPRPAQFVPVSSIPLSPDGRVDAVSLSRLLVSDPGLLEQWEIRAKSVEGVDHAAAVVDGSAKRALPLHLSNLLPELLARPATSGGPPEGAAPLSAPSAPASHRRAIVDGGRLEIDLSAPVSLSEALDRAAEASRHGLVYIESDGSPHFQSYATLLERASRILAGLQALGVRPLDRIVLQLERHQDFIETFWACVLGGFVPVPLAVPPSYDKASPSLQTLQSVWHVLGEPRIVAERRAVDDIAAAADRLQLNGARVHAVEDLCIAQIGQRHRSEPDDLALLMLTSGSTGTPKAVRLTHRNVLSRTAGSRQLNGFSDRDVTLNWMPLDHVAGLIYFHIRDVYLGCRQIHVPTGVILLDPLRWIDYLDRYKATITFAPNFAFALVNDRADELAGRSWDLSSLRFVLNGAEAIVARTARRFLSLLGPFGLSPTSMHPAWGMSETSSGVIYGDTFSLATTSDDDAFVEVGRPIPTLSMRIVDAADRVVSEGTVGRLQVRGPVVTRGYFGSPELTRESFSADGWFNTGDLGTIREGRLTITGREKDVVIINSVNYYCHAIESAVEAVDGVETALTAACAVRPAGANTDRLAIFFHASDSREVPDLLARVRAEVSAKIGIAPDYLLPVDAAAIPKTSLGKIQRSELGRRFLAGEFEETLKEVDRLTANANTIPDWFYRKVWRHKHGVSDHSLLNARGVALIFANGDEVGGEVRRRLDARGVRCVTVEAGETFAVTGADGYRIDPRAESDYDRLLRTLSETGCTPNHIVHLWGRGPYTGEAIGEAIEAAQFGGVLSALWLVKALARASRSASPTWITFVASHAQCVHPGEKVAYEKTSAVGLLKSLPQEIPWVRCRHVDLHENDPSAAASLIVDEMCVLQDDREVAYRHGQRLIAGLEKVAFQPEARREPLFKRNGTYLITGGAGGIGELIAEFLLERFDANLLLVGRSALDGRRDDIIRRQYGGRAAYESVDVCDEPGLTKIVDEYRSRWGRRFDGVIHLAGTYYESLATEDTADRFLALLRPKTLGTDVLHRLLTAQGEGFLIASSSIAGFFGGASIGAYTAANSFQDAFAAHFRERGAVKHYCFNWSNWNDVGQSRGYQLKDSPRARGYLPIASSQALQSLLIGLAYGESGLLIGLDGGHRHIRRSLVEDADVLERLVLYYSTSDRGRTNEALRALEIRDRFGVPSSPELVEISRMPTTCTGEVDREQLARLGRGREGHATTMPPRTDAERRLVEIWMRVLGVSSVSCDDNFFELGGDSLLAARLVVHMRDAFGREIPLRAVFDADTLSDLAELVGNSEPAPADTATPMTARAVAFDPAEMLARLDHLGDEELDSLLNQIVDRVVEE